MSCRRSLNELCLLFTDLLSKRREGIPNILANDSLLDPPARNGTAYGRICLYGTSREASAGRTIKGEARA